MTDYISRWLDKFSCMPVLDIGKKKITVTGIIDKHYGPRIDFCKIKISVETCSQFVVEYSDFVNNKFDDDFKSEYIMNSIFGLLDVLMVTKTGVITNIKILFEEIEYNEIESSPFAFREAGRDVGRKIISEMKNKL